jgi:hypothetical protein
VPLKQSPQGQFCPSNGRLLRQRAARSDILKTFSDIYIFLRKPYGNYSMDIVKTASFRYNAGYSGGHSVASSVLPPMRLQFAFGKYPSAKYPKR